MFQDFGNDVHNKLVNLTPNEHDELMQKSILQSSSLVYRRSGTTNLNSALVVPRFYIRTSPLPTIFSPHS